MSDSILKMDGEDSPAHGSRNPVVLKDVRLTATYFNEEGEEFPLDLRIDGVCTASISSNKNFERVFGEDGKVIGFWPGALEHYFRFRQTPAVRHPEVVEKAGSLDQPGEHGWSRYIPPEEDDEE